MLKITTPLVGIIKIYSDIELNKREEIKAVTCTS